MQAIFSRGVFLALLLLLAGCGEREPMVIKPPKPSVDVVEPFLKELRAGQKAKAAQYVSSSATDELESQFVEDSKKLAAAPTLTPRFVTKAPRPPYGANVDEITMVYAAKAKDKWTTATVRILAYRDEPYKVEYWRVTNKAPAPALNSGLDEKAFKQSQTMMQWMLGGLGVLGILGLILLIWILKRKPHLIVADAPSEDRRAASTVRD